MSEAKMWLLIKYKHEDREVVGAYTTREEATYYQKMAFKNGGWGDYWVEETDVGVPYPEESTAYSPLEALLEKPIRTPDKIMDNAVDAILKKHLSSEEWEELNEKYDTPEAWEEFFDSTFSKPVRIKLTSDYDEVTKPYHYCITDDVEVMDVIKWVFEGSEIDLTPWKAACLYAVIKYLLRCTRKKGEQDIDKAYQVLGEYIAHRDEEEE